MARDSASFIFQPPEREVTPAACMASVKPTLVSVRTISSCVSLASLGSALT